MTDTVFILPGYPDGEAMIVRRSGSVQRGPRAELAPSLDGTHALLLPGQQVRAFATPLPDKVRGADRINAARFAHEDRIASDLDALHIVLGTQDGDGNVPTLMVSPGDMDDALADNDPRAVFADFDALAGAGPDPISLLERVVLPGKLGEAVDADWADAPGLSLGDADLARALFARLDAGEALDLRSGPYRRRIQVQAGPWARIAAVALTCVALGTGLGLADARAKTVQADALRAEAAALYTQATGQAAPDNIARAASRAAPADTDPAAFLALSDRLFATLATQPDVRVERMSFDVTENSLRLRLIYPGFEAAGALERAALGVGATLTTGGVREQGGRYVGDAAFSLASGDGA